MPKLLLLFSILTCVLSIFLVLDVNQLQPYQDLLKSYIPLYPRNAINHGVQYIRSKMYYSDSNLERVFTKNELVKYNGEDGSDIYLSILGKVYDVTKGRKHYGPGEGYHGFAGRDGTRAFVTGKFDDEGLIESIDGLKVDDLLGLEGWQAFYEKDYIYLGKLEGEFYDINGKPTASMNWLNEQLEIGHKKQRDKEEQARRFPPCNSEWTKELGTRLWCTNLSGGIQRDWVGVPREFHQPGRKIMRCACVRTTGPPSDDPESKTHKNRGDLDNPRFKAYPGCDHDAVSCWLKK